MNNPTPTLCSQSVGNKHSGKLDHERLDGHFKLSLQRDDPQANSKFWKRRNLHSSAAFGCARRQVAELRATMTRTISSYDSRNPLATAQIPIYTRNVTHGQIQVKPIDKCPMSVLFNEMMETVLVTSVRLDASAWNRSGLCKALGRK